MPTTGKGDEAISNENKRNASTKIQRAVRERQSRQKQQQKFEEWFLTGDWDDAPDIVDDVHKKATRLLKSKLRSSKTAPIDGLDTATSTAQEINDELIKDCIKKAMTPKPDGSEPTEKEINTSLDDYKTKYMSNIQTAYGGASEKLRDEDIRQLADLDQEFQSMYESEKTKNKDAKSFDIQINKDITFTTGDKNKLSVRGKGTPKEKMEQLMGQLELAKNRTTEPKMNTPINIKLCGTQAEQKEKLFHIMKICKERGIDLSNYTLGEDEKKLEDVTIKDMKAGSWASLKPWKTIPNTVKECRKTFDLANPNSDAYIKMELDDTSQKDKNGKPFTYESAEKEIKELKKMKGKSRLSENGETKLESLEKAIKAHEEKYKTKQTVTVVNSSKGPMGAIARAKEVSKAIAEHKNNTKQLKELKKGLKFLKSNPIANFRQEDKIKTQEGALEQSAKALRTLGINPATIDKIGKARKNTGRIRRIRAAIRYTKRKANYIGQKINSLRKKKKINELIKNIASDDLTDTFKKTQKEELTKLLAKSSYFGGDYFKHAETQGKKQGLDISIIIIKAKARKEARGFKSSSMSKYSKLGIWRSSDQKRETQRLQTSVKKDMTELSKAATYGLAPGASNENKAKQIQSSLETELQLKEALLAELKKSPITEAQLKVANTKKEIKILKKQIKKAKKLVTDSNKLLLQTMELNQGDNKIFDKCLERAKAAKNTKNLKKYLQKEYERRVEGNVDGSLTFDSKAISDQKVTIDGVTISLDNDGNLDFKNIVDIKSNFETENESSIKAGNHIKEGNPEAALRSLNHITENITENHHDYHAVTEMKNEMADAALTITQNELGADKVLSDAAPVFMNNSAAAQALIMVAGEEEAIAMITNEASINEASIIVTEANDLYTLGNLPAIDTDIEIRETQPAEPPKSNAKELENLHDILSEKRKDEQDAALSMRMPNRAPTTEQKKDLTTTPKNTSRM